jgi:hypothetical protein
MLLSMALEIAKIKPLKVKSRQVVSQFAIFAIMTARAFRPAGRFSPLGPLGIVVHLFQLGLYVRDLVQ